MRPLTGCVASWGVWWKEWGCVCRVYKQVLSCVQNVIVCTLTLAKPCMNVYIFQFVSVCAGVSLIRPSSFTLLWELIAQPEHKGSPWWSRPPWSLFMPIWISKWASLQIGWWGPDLYTRSSLSAGHRLSLSLPTRNLCRRRDYQRGLVFLGLVLSQSSLS